MKCWTAGNRKNEICCRRIERIKLQATKIERMKLFGVNTIDSQLVRIYFWKAGSRKNKICCRRIERMKLRATKIERMKLFGVNMKQARQIDRLKTIAIKTDHCLNCLNFIRISKQFSAKILLMQKVSLELAITKSKLKTEQTTETNNKRNNN